MPLLIPFYMATVTLFIRNIEVKYFTPISLIINQLQNGFIKRGPHAVFFNFPKIFTFLFFVYV